MPRMAYGYVNVSHYARSPEGDEHWFRTRAERDEALARKRARAVEDGIAHAAARASIYPIKAPLTAAIQSALDASA